MRRIFLAALAVLALSSPVHAQGIGKIDQRIDAKGLSGNDATNGQVPVWSSSTGKWVPGSAGVSSTRAINTTSPLTGGGDLSTDRTIAFSTQTANTVLAGATSGGAAAPSFRALVAGDIPSLPASQITTGQLALARGGTGVDGSSQTQNRFLGSPNGSDGALAVRAIVAADLPQIPTSQIANTGQLALGSGSNSAPTYSFASATGYGMYEDAFTVAFAVNQTKTFTIGSTGVVVHSGNLTLNNGYVLGSSVILGSADTLGTKLVEGTGAAGGQGLLVKLGDDSAYGSVDAKRIDTLQGHGSVNFGFRAADGTAHWFLYRWGANETAADLRINDATSGYDLYAFRKNASTPTFTLASQAQIGWDSSSNTIAQSPSLDTQIKRDAAGGIGFYGSGSTYGWIATGGIKLGLTTKTADYTATTADHTILVNSASTPTTITLYAASGNSGRRLVIKNLHATGTVTIDANASETIDGSTTKTISTQYGSYTIVCDGSNWHIE